ncbi:MAG: methionine aminotransferase [Verrucomicrobia bacterium]|nr:methionine aminotransferase [Verrucomicrobiota bacterium]
MLDFSASLRSKLPKVGTTIFTVMSGLAAKENALNLSQGFPDFNCSDELIELVHQAMRQGHNQYAPMPGVMALREQIAFKTASLYGTQYDPEKEITVTAGATQAIFTAIAACVDEDDEVLIFTPAYDCYEPAIELVGGKPVYVQLKTPDYCIDWEEVKKMINRKTKMIILNSPHNPTGSVLSKDDFIQLEKIVHNSNIILLSDEVYEHIVFDGKSHQSIACFPELAKRSFIVSSFGKTYHTTGWKVGYCLAPADLMLEFRKTHQYNVFTVNSAAQYAYAEFLKKEDEFLGLNYFYQEKRDLFQSLIKGSRFKLSNTAGTYFQLLDYSTISDEKDTDFAVRLTKEHKIASIPVSVFYNKAIDNKVLRFCFAKENHTLEEAAAILQKI